MKKYVILAAVLAVMAGGAFAQGKKVEGPTPFHAKSGVVLGPVSAVNTAKSEITIGNHIIKVDPKDAARLKVGDDVTVRVMKGTTIVETAAERGAPKLLEAKSGVVMGPITALDPATNEITIGDHIIKLTPKQMTGLKTGDDVRIEIRAGRAMVARQPAK